MWFELVGNEGIGYNEDIFPHRQLGRISIISLVQLSSQDGVFAPKNAMREGA